MLDEPDDEEPDDDDPLTCDLCGGDLEDSADGTEYVCPDCDADDDAYL
jgi:predicted RNA-binding Zn-ribbon protein involved in translation (DUF1610 family)